MNVKELRDLLNSLPAELDGTDVLIPSKTGENIAAGANTFHFVNVATSEIGDVHLVTEAECGTMILGCEVRRSILLAAE